ncbi:hypothetical protein BBP40_011458 [Aspergillus hancockii]|nr:hypothetical protein BBP40_011458 [Aspergillus hancockii]
MPSFHGTISIEAVVGLTTHSELIRSLSDSGLTILTATSMRVVQSHSRLTSIPICVLLMADISICNLNFSMHLEWTTLVDAAGKSETLRHMLWPSYFNHTHTPERRLHSDGMECKEQMSKIQELVADACYNREHCSLGYVAPIAISVLCLECNVRVLIP